MYEAVDCDLLLYENDFCIVHQHRDIKNIEQIPKKNFQMYVTGLSIIDSALILRKTKPKVYSLTQKGNQL